ncbi:MAG: AlwI family type II restriction endonuclease [Planctomycetaceae bacterium]|jgi:hypothetical protein|nr:AlwI family type II restriction endonuclease [Planctomycetaceae bacterium]
MATIQSKVLFITTSPRSPLKMLPEIELLQTYFGGKKWNKTTQAEFMQILKEENFFLGEGVNDPAFSARDRINRAPKSLGFVSLSPCINLTAAGQEFVQSKRKEEIFLRQLLKFQIPSPYHKQGSKSADFYIKPYLEMFRLIRHFGSLTLDEIMLFGLQLVDYRKFDVITAKIEQFRKDKTNHENSYREFRGQYLERELRIIYQDEIAAGNTATRESRNESIENFLKTKGSNMRDYTDALFRYLRTTGMVQISHLGKSISITQDKVQEVDYFLDHTDRNPCFVDNEKQYAAYLADTSIPQLLTDNRKLLLQKIHSEFPNLKINKTDSANQLKDILFDERAKQKENLLTQQIAAIKNHRLYDEIQETFQNIQKGSLYDVPLILEWNVWRAMIMLDGGEIKANLKFDDIGSPMATAQGNVADIVCNYGSFDLTVEVTMQSGQRQYEMEGEPVSRHLAKLKKETGKPAYCLFVAPQINEACIAHFFTLHKVNVSYYGGVSNIVPLPLNVFSKMVADSYKAFYTPEPKHIRQFFERSRELAASCNNEQEWYEGITKTVLNWLES